MDDRKEKTGVAVGGWYGTTYCKYLRNIVVLIKNHEDYSK